MLNQFILLSREELISKIFQLTNDNKILRSDLMKYKLLFNCENYKFLLQIRDNKSFINYLNSSQNKQQNNVMKSVFILKYICYECS
jgi:hypothetical protein